MGKAIWRKYYAVSGLEVSMNGAVRRTYKDIRTVWGDSEPRMMERMHDSDGNLYVQIRKPRREDIRIDFLVASCFLERPSREQCFIIHLDKDKEHCWKSNLKWATSYEYGEHYLDDTTINTPDGFRLVREGLYVSKTGEVKDSNGVKKVFDTLFDSDVASEVAINPHILVSGSGIHYERLDIEDLVVAAYLPKPEGMRWPEILHKDNDYKNCSLDNLEWVDREDERYKKYIASRKEMIYERNLTTNPVLANALFKTKHENNS